MIKGSENLKEAQYHFLLSQKEFLLFLLYITKYVEEFFQSNGRSSSPIYHAFSAVEMLINSLLIMIPFDGNGGVELKEDIRVLINAIKNLEREYQVSGLKFKPGSIEYRMLEVLRRAAEMLEESMGRTEKSSGKHKPRKIKLT